MHLSRLGRRFRREVRVDHRFRSSVQQERPQVNARPLAKSLYGLVAAVFLVVGASVLSLRTGLLPDSARNVIIDIARGDLNALHLLQEFACIVVFAGLISIWFIRHYEQSKFFHWAMTTFWGLFALVHWFNVGGPPGSVTRPTINTIPFIVFVIVGLLRKRAEQRPAPERM